MERQIITVDISPHRGMVPQLRVSQGDIGRPLGVYIMQDGAALDCSSYSADLYILKSDGNYYVAPATVDSTETNLIIWSTEVQETPVAGECAGQIRITHGEEDIGTARFVEYVEASPGFSGAGSESAVESIKEYVRQAAASAETASGAASSATGSASAASGSASAAASSASAAAGSASSAHTDAETASQAAQTAQDVAASIPEDYSQLSDDVSGLKSAVDNYGDRLDDVDGEVYIDPNKFRIGNINITTSGWVYNNSTTRVSTIEGFTYKLNVGDTIKLKDYTNARFYLGWLADGEYHTKSWRTSDVLITQAGDYVINISHLTETDLHGNKAELLDLLEIKRDNYLEKSVADDIDTIKLNGINFPLTEWHENGYYVLSSSATSVNISTPVSSGGYKCMAVPCLPGDVFTLTASGTLAARPYAFLSSASGENNILEKAGSRDLVVENKKIIAPVGAVYAIFNADYSLPYKVIKGELLKDKKTELNNSFIPWELGNIAFNGTASPTYKVDRDSRVRTPEGFSIYLHTGDIIGMSDYTNAEFYAGWKDNNGVYHNTTVKTTDYRITQDGEYYFLLRNITEVDVSEDISVLTNLFFIKMFVDTDQVYNESCKYSKQIIDKENGGMNYHLFKPCSPKFAMHRGYSTLAPENTIPAFKLAGENGAWAIETDVFETTDGYFVCHHDSTVDRMTDGTGNITGMTLAQIEALTIDAGAHIEDYPNLKIPKFTDYLSVCRRYGCICFVEIKTVNNYQNLMNVINEMGMENNVIFLVSLARLLPILRFYTKAPIAALGYQNTVNSDMIDEIKTYYNTAIDASNATITDDTDIIKAHKNNMPVFAWTIDTEQRADELFRFGVDVITSNSIPKLT